MNTANLQLEGLCVAIAALTELMKDKGLITAEEVDLALEHAARSAVEGKAADLSAANLEAITFPVRLLRLANKTSFAGQPLPFQELARRVGEMKDRPALTEEELLGIARGIEHERDA